MANPIYFPLLAGQGESVGGPHETAGLAGFPARDFFAPAGTLAVAPESGTVLRLSGQPATVPPRGPGKAYGLSEYIKGDSGTIYFITHLGSTSVAPGQSLVAGQPIGTVADFDRYGTASHLHIGTQGPVAVDQLATAQKLAQTSAAQAGAVAATAGSQPDGKDALDWITAALGFGTYVVNPASAGTLVASGVGDAAKSIPVVGPLFSGIDAVGNAFQKLVDLLTDPIRILELIGGLFMVYVGIKVLTAWVTGTASSSQTIKVATQAATAPFRTAGRAASLAAAA